MINWNEGKKEGRRNFAVDAYTDADPDVLKTFEGDEPLELMRDYKPISPHEAYSAGIENARTEELLDGIDLELEPENDADKEKQIARVRQQIIDHQTQFNPSDEQLETASEILKSDKAINLNRVKNPGFKTTLPEGVNDTASPNPSELTIDNPTRISHYAVGEHFAKPVPKREKPSFFKRLFG